MFLFQETESKKALDEAFICLKLARLVNDAPPNIVEFFGASILPHFSGNHNLQLFLELMPGECQIHVYTCTWEVHHSAFGSYMYMYVVLDT